MAPMKRCQYARQDMNALERLALCIGVWVVLTGVVFLMGWL